KVLMVTTEYPPMHGGVGRYTFNLVRELRKKGLKVLEASSEEGVGDYFGLSEYFSPARSRTQAYQ
ncbi:MAG: hypothetical protein ACM3JQ_04400, partial [Candidatus Eiseniibacteriota bacterium]